MGSPVRFSAAPWAGPVGPGAVTYAWDLDGDGTTDSTEAEPARTYPTAGHRTASLEVTFPDGRTARGSATFTVHPPPPGAFATVGLHTPTPVPGEPVRLSRGIPDSDNTLDFGDGTSDAGRAFFVTHPYAQTGDHVVTLTTRFEGAQGTSVDKLSVPVREDVAPLASATCNVRVRRVGQAVPCRSDVLDPDDFATSYAWDFGEGQSSTEQNPSHAYAQAGDYTATVTATLSRGQSVTTKVAVQILDPVEVSDTSRDAVKPALSALAMPFVFRAAPGGASVARARVGAVVRYRLSEPARTTLTVEQRAAGRKVGRQCRKPSRSNRGRKPCTRWAAVRGSFIHAGAAGENRFKFTGRLRGRKLKPGRYRLVAVAKDRAGNRSE